ncbi:MAG: SCP2 sterol-binding domain-containing protein [Bradyrhizobium sp.]|uniref:SCP2 sterol-binding domain-containing protein n=1 Tax=Bradyrhizobium sp. TaxID=376 RepID=UPI0025C18FCB|nr:SCP2 sterol-binding domain-containing protein [Bradyrhizobium sp.]MBI5263429.1 SCP2 sterol-binding domain-containing protein [Bradyrhizobium sp.]
MAELAQITDRVTASVGAESGLDAVIKFVFPETGILLIDGRTIPNRVTNEDGASDITITLKLDNFEKILDQKLNPKIALMTGRMRLRGDIRIAMRLDKVFGLPPSMA